MILHHTTAFVATVVQLKVPDDFTPEYLNPLHWQIDKSVLVSTHNLLQTAAGFMFGSLSLSNITRPQRVLQIGMGGGATTNFLANMPVNLSIDVVDIDPILYDVAKRFFDLTENERVKVKIEDGFVKFIEGAVNEKIIYDSILLDTTGSDGKYRYGPAPVFSTSKVVADLSKLIGPTGVLSVSMFSTRIQEDQEKMIESLYQKFFKQCFSLRFTAKHQKMLFCSNRRDFGWRGKEEDVLARLEDFDFTVHTNLHYVVSTLNI